MRVEFAISTASALHFAALFVGVQTAGIYCITPTRVRAKGHFCRRPGLLEKIGSWSWKFPFMILLRMEHAKDDGAFVDDLVKYL